jgi:hypothetical protein
LICWRRSASPGPRSTPPTPGRAIAFADPDIDNPLALSPMPEGDLDLERIRAARIKGYEGDSCAECGNFTLIRNGTCLKRDTCGATSGCS